MSYLNPGLPKPVPRRTALMRPIGTQSPKIAW